MERIVLGLDEEAASDTAVEWLARRLPGHPATVHIITVTDMLSSNYPKVGKHLAAARDTLAAVAPDSRISTSFEDGPIPDVLADRARSADLMVIGSHRRRPIRSALTGWMPLRLASHAPCPVVVVPDDWTRSRGPILVGIDDDDSSETAVQFAAIEAVREGTSLTVVHSWLMPVAALDGPTVLLADPVHVRSAHRLVLDQGLAKVRARYPALTIESQLIEDDPTSALTNRAAESSLVVIGTHHRGLITGSLFGSTGQDLLLDSRTPVCVVPSHG